MHLSPLRLMCRTLHPCASRPGPRNEQQKIDLRPRQGCGACTKFSAAWLPVPPPANPLQLERCQQKDSEIRCRAGGKDFRQRFRAAERSEPCLSLIPGQERRKKKGKNPAQALARAPRAAGFVAPFCSTLWYYLARLIALASFFPFRKFLFGEKNKEQNSYGCLRHLATLSNPEPARNILAQVMLPELTPRSRHA